jgi:hypothetical protein
MSTGVGVVDGVVTTVAILVQAVDGGGIQVSSIIGGVQLPTLIFYYDLRQQSRKSHPGQITWVAK